MSTLNISRPIPPAPTNLSLGSGVKSTTLKWDLTPYADSFEVWSNTVSDLTTATQTAVVTTNQFALSGVSTPTYFWVRTVNGFGVRGAFTTPVFYTPSQITSADTVGVSPISSPLGISVSSGSGDVPVYNQFYSYTSASFVAGENSLTNISLMGITTISNVNIAGSFARLRVYSRISVYDTETNALVPGTDERALMYQTDGTFVYGNLTNISNYSKAYIGGFRGLLTPGRTYSIYMSFMKEQTQGTGAMPTLTLRVNNSDVLVSSSATI